MLACVYQPSDSRLYKGGVVTPLVHIGGQRPPRRPPGSLKPKPPKLPPKPQSLSTSSNSDKDTKSSPSHKHNASEIIPSPKRNSSNLIQNTKLNDSPIQGSSENSDKENKQEGNLIVKKQDRNTEHKHNTKDKKEVKCNVLREQEFRIGKKPRDIPIPHKIIRSITSSVDDKSLSSDVSNSPENDGRRNNHFNKSETRIANGVNCLNNMPKGNQEKLLKTKNDLDKRQTQRYKSKTDRLEVSTLQETDSKDGICDRVVTITDNDGKIYCIDNLILVGEDVFGKIRNDDFATDGSKLLDANTSKSVNKLTVKNKTESNSVTLLADGTKSLELPEGVELTLGELRAMALRQQQQIDCQHQLLAAREQRLRFLKQQEAKHHQVAAENERLRRLRERVEAQELKLRRLRALRGQLDQTNINNVALTSDLESIRALFNEKEKELSVAVAKVEELTRQLEEVRRERAAPPRPQPPAAQELDKLRRELMYRNKLNEQQNARLSQQREALTARQAEMASIDQRISELQGRLQRKRVANRQLASQISGKHAARSNNAAGLAVSGYPISGQQNNPLSKGQPPRGNIAAVEPYNHIPHAQSVSHNFQALKHNAVQNNATMKLLNQNDATANHIINQQDGHYLQQQKQFTNQSNMFSNGSYPQRLQANLIQTDAQFNPSYPKQNDINTYQQQGMSNQMVVQSEQKILLEHINKYNNIDLQKNINQQQTNANGKQQRTNNNSSNNEQEFLPEFTASKSDPKYQTLPYNTKFSTSNNNTNSKGNKVQFYDDNITKQSSETSSSTAASMTTGIVKTSSSSNVNNILSTVSSGNNLNHMTAHSTPLTMNNKGHAVPLLNNNAENNGGYHIQKSESSGKCNQEEKENLHGNVRDNQQPKVVGEQFKVAGFGGGRAELVRAFSQHSTVTSTSTAQIMKPVSSVAPTTVQVASGKPSPIYQSSSTKIQPVQPQTVSNSLTNNSNTQQNVVHSYQTQNKQGSSGSVPLQNSSVSSLLMSPPQSSSTPLSTPDVSTDNSVPKPALPPKPAPKVPASELSQTSDSKSSENTLSIPSNDSQSEQESNGLNTPQSNNTTTSSTDGQQMIIKARPLTIRKQPLSEQPKLRNQSNNALKNNNVNIATTRRIEMPSAFLFADMEQQQQRESSPQSDKGNDNKNNVNKLQHSGSNSCLNSDVVDRAVISSESSETSSEDQSDKNGVSILTDQMNTVDLNNTNGEVVSRRVKKGNLKQGGKVNLSRRVSFDPLALLLDASLEGELELVKKTATQVANPSAANDEGITALHNAICAGHFEIVKFLVEFGCDVNAQDSDGWTPLHCAASCNNVAMVRFLVENGACIFATTLSDHETAAQKCEEDEEGFDGCSEYLYSVQEKLGIMNGGAVFAVFPYTAHECDELSFNAGSRLSVLRKGDEAEREWWWVHDNLGREGYVPRNLLGLYPRVTPKQEHQQ